MIPVNSRRLGDARLLVVGVGGLAAPATRALVASGVGALTLVDDDVVEASNLHRQTLFDSHHVGASKASTAADVLRTMAPNLRCEVRSVRLLPDNAASLMRGHDLVIDGTDNLASKFLIADAARLARLPCVHAGVIRWTGWALSSAAVRGPCMRCVFEDLPSDRVESCAAAGVIGPVVGVIGALSAALVTDLLERGDAAAGRLYSYDALAGRLRQTRVRSRSGCPLCAGRVADLDISRYTACRSHSQPQENPCP